MKIYYADPDRSATPLQSPPDNNAKKCTKKNETCTVRICPRSLPTIFIVNLLFQIGQDFLDSQ